MANTSVIIIESKFPPFGPRVERAAEKGDKEVMELLLKHGAQPDFDDWNRCTPLSQAIETGNAAVVELLLAQGAKVDYRYRIVSKFNRFTLDRRLTLSTFTIAVGKWI